MGIGDFFKNAFKKQTCAFCGKECGMMSRTKIKGDEYICSDCDDKCSFFVRKGSFTKEELAGHMEYMERSDRIFREVIAPNDRGLAGSVLPDPVKVEGIQFYDEFGMFRIRNSSRDRKSQYPVELIRYDQVADYEPYFEERDSDEPGKPKEFEECGLNLTLVGGRYTVPGELTKGSRSHPYIIEPIKICYARNESDKNRAVMALRSTVAHFDRIFGVHDDRKALFQFGMSKDEKRDLNATIAFAKTFSEAIKVAKNGEESLTEEKKNEIRQHMNAMEDAQTDGLSVYTRRADEAEAKIRPDWYSDAVKRDGGMPEGSVTGAAAPAQSDEGTPAADGWTCGCGAVNHGKFCEYCGSPRGGK